MAIGLHLEGSRFEDLFESFESGAAGAKYVIKYACTNTAESKHPLPSLAGDFWHLSSRARFSKP